MSRNGSGTYSLPAGNPVVSGTTITSTWANTTLSDIAGALTGSVASDGQTPMSANLNMATNKIINVADPTVAQDAATKAYTDTAIATQATTDAGLYLAKASNLSDVANATTARNNLSAAKSGANSDITSLTGLSTALSVGQGGTGQTSYTDGQLLIGNTTGNTLTKATLTAGTNTTITNGSGAITINSSAYPLTSGTAQATTSGTSVSFGSIPSWAKRVTIMFNGITTSGSSIPMVRLQTGSGSTVTSGYSSFGWTNNASSATDTVGFYLAGTWSSLNALNGTCTLSLINSSTNSWVQNAMAGGGTATANKSMSMGNVSLSSALTGVVLQAVNGTDTFTAGSINILYE